jgi:serine/threonine protein kinase
MQLNNKAFEFRCVWDSLWNSRRRQYQTAAAGELGGTPGYCAPEQWFTLEDIIDGRVDIFSLGVLFYEMMT